MDDSNFEMLKTFLKIKNIMYVFKLQIFTVFILSFESHTNCFS